MVDGTWLAALAGGLLIGVGAVALMLSLGRIAGISGIVGGLLALERPDIGWRSAFVAGLIAGPLLMVAAGGGWPAVQVEAPGWLVVVAGMLVGFGTALGHGCTSGHGVCGLARLSRRSLVATLVFMGVAAAVVFVRRHVLGA